MTDDLDYADDADREQEEALADARERARGAPPVTMPLWSWREAAAMRAWYDPDDERDRRRDREEET